MILDYLLYGRYSATDLIIVAVVMIFAFVFHNYVQAWTASRYGDSSPRFSGFLSFDLQQHLEPMGVLFLFLLGFGWPKAIPTNSRNYKGRGQQEAIVWYSGPVAYLIVAFAAALIATIFGASGSTVFFRSFLLALLHRHHSRGDQPLSGFPPRRRESCPRLGQRRRAARDPANSLIRHPRVYRDLLAAQLYGHLRRSPGALPSRHLAHHQPHPRLVVPRCC